MQLYDLKWQANRSCYNWKPMANLQGFLWDVLAPKLQSLQVIELSGFTNLQSPIAHYYKIVTDPSCFHSKINCLSHFISNQKLFFKKNIIDIESAPLPAQQNRLTSKPSQRQTIIWNRCECTTTQPSPWRELAGTGCRRRPRWTSASWAQQKLRSSIDILHDLMIYFAYSTFNLLSFFDCFAVDFFILISEYMICCFLMSRCFGHKFPHSKQVFDGHFN